MTHRRFPKRGWPYSGGFSLKVASYAPFRVLPYLWACCSIDKISRGDCTLNPYRQASDDGSRTTLIQLHIGCVTPTYRIQLHIGCCVTSTYRPCFTKLPLSIQTRRQMPVAHGS